MSFRVGQGFDVHRFAPGRALVLCGVRLSEEDGLDGHSDADVALHAVADAIFGAVGAGDLGEHFPDGAATSRDAESSVFVSCALDVAAAAGFAVANCDVTIVGERPRIAPFRSQLRSSLATILGIECAAVSVKATTTDGLGFLGRGEGLGALAVVLMEKE